jgi:hypothetical protein
MSAALLLFEDLGVAAFTGLMASEVHGTRGNLGDGIAAVVSVLSKALRHQKRAQPQKYQAADHENRSQPKEMPRIFEDIHKDLHRLL